MRKTVVKVGDRYGRLDVQARFKSRGGASYWVCRCTCGKIKVIKGDSLRSGNSQSCGCLRLERFHQRCSPDLTGQTIAGRRIIGKTHYENKPGQVWEVECVACGKKSTTTTYQLRVLKQGCLSCGQENEHPLWSAYIRLCWCSKKRADKEILTFERFVEIASTAECHYCGDSVTWPKRKASRYNLDRKDNTRGYAFDNVVVCCHLCNRLKGNRFSYDEFLRIARVLREIRIERTVAKPACPTP